MGHYESSAKRKIYSTKCLHKEVEKFHTSDLAVHLKTLEQKETDSPRRSRWQEIIKLRAEMNKIKTKRTMKQRAGSSRKATR